MTKVHDNCIFMQIGYNGKRYCEKYHMPIDDNDQWACGEWEGGKNVHD